MIEMRGKIIFIFIDFIILYKIIGFVLSYSIGTLINILYNCLSLESYEVLSWIYWHNNKKQPYSLKKQPQNKTKRETQPTELQVNWKI